MAAWPDSPQNGEGWKERALSCYSRFTYSCFTHRSLREFFQGHQLVMLKRLIYSPTLSHLMQSKLTFFNSLLFNLLGYH